MPQDKSYKQKLIFINHLCFIIQVIYHSWWLSDLFDNFILLLWILIHFCYVYRLKHVKTLFLCVLCMMSMRRFDIRLIWFTRCKLKLEVVKSKITSHWRLYNWFRLSFHWSCLFNLMCCFFPYHKSVCFIFLTLDRSIFASILNVMFVANVLV